MNTNQIANLYFAHDQKASNKCASLLQALVAYNNGLVNQQTIFAHFKGIKKAQLAICAMATTSMADGDVQWTMSQLLSTWERY